LILDDFIEIALEVTGMTRARWEFLSRTMRDDAAMNRIMREDWGKKPRDSEEAVREYYRESKIWFLNTFNNGVGGLLRLSQGGSPSLSSWHERFIHDFKVGGPILDYGGGLFKDTWPFILLGCSVSVAEVRGPVTEFLKRCLSLLGITDRARVIEVDSDLPIKEMYHGAVCYETLEHLVDPVGLTKHLHEHLIQGAPFAFSVSFGDTPHAPYHIARNAPLGNADVWPSKLKDIGFFPFWKDEQGQHLQIWRRA